MLELLELIDPAVASAVADEIRRQHEGLEMIASENYTSPAVLACQGSVLTNKYAEGYPGRRYYGGCEFVDVVERLAIDRAKSLFGAEFANVQPHAGSQANMAVCFATMSPGDTFMAMNLAHGGHLTHGSPVNFSGKLYNAISYGVDQKTERIDFAQVAQLAREHRPKLIIAGATAYSRTIDFGAFAEIAKEVGALLMVDMAHISGLVAGGAHPNPVPHADFVSSTTHKTLRGPRSGFILCKNDWGQKINSAVFPCLQGGPLMHVVAAKAVAFGEASTPAFKSYAAQICSNAKALAEELLRAGLRLATGGTDNHMLLVDVTVRNALTGKIVEQALDQAGITCNKNMIPYDPRKPMDPSGIRLGTPALTTRGMREPEMKQIAGWILAAMDSVDDATKLAAIRSEIRSFCQDFPVPGIEIGATQTL